jgi:hypothetical protein
MRRSAEPKPRPESESVPELESGPKPESALRPAWSPAFGAAPGLAFAAGSGSIGLSSLPADMAALMAGLILAFLGPIAIAALVLGDDRVLGERATAGKTTNTTNTANTTNTTDGIATEADTDGARPTLGERSRSGGRSTAREQPTAGHADRSTDAHNEGRSGRPKGTDR